MQLHISHYAFELILAFLHEKKFMLLLAILNTRVHLQVSSGAPKRQTAPSGPSSSVSFSFSGTHVSSLVVDEAPRPLLSEADEKLLATESVNIKFGLNAKQSKISGFRHDNETAPTAMIPLPVMYDTIFVRLLHCILRLLIISS